jgi:uncharacterized delta-60 repeat protein
MPDGRIIVGGHTSFSGTNHFFATRFTGAGALDTTFGSGGSILTDVGPGHDEALSLALQPDGKVVLAGETNVGPTGDFAVVRYTTAGVLDPTFSGDGIQITSTASGEDAARGVVVRTDGTIVAAGYGGGQFVSVRYLTGGVLDPTYSGDGIQPDSVGTLGAAASAIALQADGRVVLAGGMDHGGNASIALIRYV